jgi:hypothetical protein
MSIFKSEPMPPGHYDLDDCGGVHVLPHVLSAEERQQVQDAWDQAGKQMRRKTKNKNRVSPKSS